jgi:hypothetical protein
VLLALDRPGEAIIVLHQALWGPLEASNLCWRRPRHPPDEARQGAFQSGFFDRMIDQQNFCTEIETIRAGIRNDLPIIGATPRLDATLQRASEASV